MPSFFYQILDPDGERQEGTTEASSEGSLVKAFRERGMRVIRITASDKSNLKEVSRSEPQTNHSFKSLFPILIADRIAFFSQLAMMARAGLPLTESLRLIIPETPHPTFRKALENTAGQIESGLPFSSALATHPHLFPPVVTSIIASAEESGEMSDGLIRVGVHLKFWADLKRKVMQSLAYPAVVMMLAVSVVVLLVTVFIPKVQTFLSKGGNQLPATTQFLFDLSEFVKSFWPAIIGTLCFFVGGLFLLYRRPTARLWLERLMLRIPVLGETWRHAILARICGLMNVLLQSGTSLVRSLEITAQAVGSMHYQRLLDETHENVLRGLSLRRALEQPGINRSVLGVISAGEESGNLPLAFSQLETHFAESLSARILTLATLIEPALILFVGGIVAVVYVALFSAILTLVK